MQHAVKDPSVNDAAVFWVDKAIKESSGDPFKAIDVLRGYSCNPSVRKQILEPYLEEAIHDLVEVRTGVKLRSETRSEVEPPKRDTCSLGDCPDEALYGHNGMCQKHYAQHRAGKIKEKNKPASTSNVVGIYVMAADAIESMLDMRLPSTKKKLGDATEVILKKELDFCRKKIRGEMINAVFYRRLISSLSAANATRGKSKVRDIAGNRDLDVLFEEATRHFDEGNIKA